MQTARSSNDLYSLTQTVINQPSLLSGDDPLWVSGQPNEDLLSRLKVYVGSGSGSGSGGLDSNRSSSRSRKPRPSPQLRRHKSSSPPPGPVQAYLNLSALKASGAALPSMKLPPTTSSASSGSSVTAPDAPAVDALRLPSPLHLKQPPDLPDSSLPLVHPHARLQLLRDARQNGVTLSLEPPPKSPNPHLGPRALPSSPAPPPLPDAGLVVRSPRYRDALVLAAAAVSGSPTQLEHFLQLQASGVLLGGYGSQGHSRDTSPTFGYSLDDDDRDHDRDHDGGDGGDGGGVDADADADADAVLASGLAGDGAGLRTRGLMAQDRIQASCDEECDRLEAVPVGLARCAS